MGSHLLDDGVQLLPCSLLRHAGVKFAQEFQIAGFVQRQGHDDVLAERVLEHRLDEISIFAMQKRGKNKRSHFFLQPQKQLPAIALADLAPFRAETGEGFHELFLVRNCVTSEGFE